MDAASRRLIVPFLRAVKAGASIHAVEAGRLLERFAPRKRSGPKATPSFVRPAKPSQKEVMGAIYEAVIKRADGICECGCGGLFEMWGVEVDHFAGGSGRRRQMQSVKTCWAITVPCHRNRTANRPSVEDWNLRFKEHAERYGYPVLQHIVHAPVQRLAR